MICWHILISCACSNTRDQQDVLKQFLHHRMLADLLVLRTGQDKPELHDRDH